MEEQFFESSDNEQESTLEIILKRLLELETKIMDRMDVLEICFAKQNQRIDEVLIEVLGAVTKETVNDEEIIEEVLNETTEEQLIEGPENREIEDESVDSKRQKTEPLVVESYYEETVPVVYQILNVTSCEDTPYPNLPFTSFDDVRKFNKALVDDEETEKFVKYLKQHIVTNDPYDIAEQILSLVMAKKILADSTWASKSYGKLRISHLTNFLKCCLRIGSFYFENFTLDLLRGQTIELLQQMRMESGLASAAKTQKTRKSLITSITSDDVHRIGA